MLIQAEQSFKKIFENWLLDFLNARQGRTLKSDVLLESQKYSLLSGGKRFRPMLAYLTFELFSTDIKKIKNLCLALELVHTYSLIHDDLPCMDNDDFRRGKPTNHKVFSEDISLLAGDGLLTDVFELIANDAFSDAETKLQVIQNLAGRIGSFGMVGGQALDMKINSQVTVENLELIHKLKTANLIEMAVLGAGLYAKLSESKLNALKEFGHCLGMAFQIKDDLLDMNDNEQDFKSYVAVLGITQTQEQLRNYSDRAQLALSQLNVQSATLSELVNFNLSRST